MSAIAPIESRQDQLPVQSESVTLIEAVLRAASDPSVDVEKMERLMVMAKDMRKEQAEAAFNGAMARIQTKMRRVSADKTNKQTSSDYATYAKLDRTLRPLYNEEGFALSFGTEEAPYPETVRVICHVTHGEGFTRKYLIDMPADGKGAKGNDVMTKTHATGSATQYGMRYLLKMIFNVAIGDDPDDDDGNGAGFDDPKDADWIRTCDQIETVEEFQTQRKKLLADYGNADKVPLPVRHALSAAMARSLPKDEV